MARFVDLHPVTPQARLIGQVVDLLRGGGVIAYPTDSGYALGCALDTKEGQDRIRAIRRLSDRHHFTLVCRDFGQLGQLVIVTNSDYRLVKQLTPGPYTFVLPATKEVPRRMLQPKKLTVGVRVPDHPVVSALLDALGEPMLSTTLLLPGDTDPMTDGWQVEERIGASIDAVLDSGECGAEPTTVLNLTGRGGPVVERLGADPRGVAEDLPTA
jgi:tRNA threonylcarbamoyl adenosine modification protein (Sua5/YciO/YrdC/YwlC family)